MLVLRYWLGPDDSDADLIVTGPGQVFDDDCCTDAVSNVSLHSCSGWIDCDEVRGFYLLATDDVTLTATTPDDDSMVEFAQTVNTVMDPPSELRLIVPSVLSTDDCVEVAVTLTEASRNPYAGGYLRPAFPPAYASAAVSATEISISAESREVGTGQGVPVSGAAFSDAACAAPLDTLTVEVGKAAGTFFLRGPNVAESSTPQIEISAAAHGMRSVSAWFHVHPRAAGEPTASHLVGPSSVKVGECVPYAIVLGSPGTLSQTVAVALSTEGTGAFYEDSECAGAIDAVTVDDSIWVVHYRTEIVATVWLEAAGITMEPEGLLVHAVP